MYIKGAKARHFINQYNQVFFPLTLDDCYCTYSIAKQHAWEYCQRQCEKFKGKRLTVLSYNNMIFTAAFEYTNPETGERMLRVETQHNTYDMKMEG